MTDTPATPLRFDLSLRKPWLGWYPKPTVVLGGVGQPAQWGRRMWQIPAGGPATVQIFLFNRLWKFGAAECTLGTEQDDVLVYSAPWLPFLPGRLRAAAG